MREQALRGETRRFLVESSSPEAVSLELSAFVVQRREQVQQVPAHALAPGRLVGTEQG